MSTTPATTSAPVALAPRGDNPFARGRDQSLAAGTVEIESQRAIAEVQAKLVIAKRFPRNEAQAYERAMQACRRKTFAKDALYAFPRAGETVSGPSIRLAEMLAANWGNIEYGIRELSRKDGVSEMEAFAWDQETNVTSSQKFTVRHVRDTRQGSKALTDERDIYELTANQAARRLRARILAVIPQDLAEDAERECRKTLEGGTDEPLADRVRKMLGAFAKFGVTSALIEKRLGHTLETVLPEEFADLTMIHNSLRDNMSKASDWFAVKEESASNAAADVNAALAAPVAQVAAPAAPVTPPAQPAQANPKETANAKTASQIPTTSAPKPASGATAQNGSPAQDAAAGAAAKPTPAATAPATAAASSAAPAAANSDDVF